MNSGELPGPALFAALKSGVEATLDVDQIKDFSGVIFGPDTSSQMLLDSCVYYLLRRLVQFGRYKLEHVRLSEQPDSELRPFLDEYVATHVRLRITPLERAKIATLIYAAVVAADRDLTNGERNAALRSAADLEITNCYICGREMNFGVRDDNVPEVDRSDWVEVEHRFPRSLGGTNTLPNLALSCHACNKAKADYGDFPDFHYEHLSTHHHESEEQFKKYLPGQLRVAVKIAGNVRCSSCQSNAEDSGGLFIGRKNLDDHWHFLNLAPFCAKCHPDKPNLPYEL